MAMGRRWRRRAAFGLAAALATSLLWPPATGAAPPAGQHLPKGYADCAALIARDAAGALALAEAWAAKGGGGEAERCRAGALVKLSRPGEAAQLYEQLALKAQRPPAQANFYALSANAWRLAGRPDDALRTIDRAIEIYPEDAALRIDRAEANAALDRFTDAIEDLSRALDIEPGNVDALVFRASAWRQVGVLQAAEADVDRALVLSPRNGEALLERGTVRRQRGDVAGARADWSAVAVAAPGSPAAAAARENLTRIDAEAVR